MLRSLAVASIVLVAACGGEPPAKAPAQAAKVEAPKPHTASDALKKRWAMPADAPIVAYVDLAALAETDIWKSFAPKLLDAANKDVGEGDKACLADVVAAAREVALGEGEKGMVAIFRLDEPKSPPQACLAARIPDAKRTVIAGANDAFEIGDDVVAFEKGFVYVGDPDLVAASLAQKSTPWPAALVLEGDRQAAFALKGDVIAGHGSLTATKSVFRIDFEGDAADEATAQSLEREAKSLKTDGGRNPVAAMLGQHVDVLRTGKNVKLSFSLDEAADKQVADLGRVVDLAQGMIGDYFAASKLAEAQEGLKLIIKAYVEDFAAADPKAPKAKKKLASYPPVPKEVPRGISVRLTEADWKPWSKLKVAVTDSRFQYEIRAAKDGQSADIIARGDLNGDGKSSQFKVSLRIDGDKLAIHPNVEQTDPLE